MRYAQAGFEVTLDPEEAQVLVVNTCAFIEAAKKTNRRYSGCGSGEA